MPRAKSQRDLTCYSTVCAAEPEFVVFHAPPEMVLEGQCGKDPEEVQVSGARGSGKRRSSPALCVVCAVSCGAAVVARRTSATAPHSFCSSWQSAARDLYRWLPRGTPSARLQRTRSYLTESQLKRVPGILAELDTRPPDAADHMHPAENRHRATARTQSAFDADLPKHRPERVAPRCCYGMSMFVILIVVQVIK